MGEVVLMTESCVDAGQLRQSDLSPISKNARARNPDTGFSLEPHVCRHCFGRLLSKAATQGDKRYVCSNCGAEAVGRSPDVLCSCGLHLKSRTVGSDAAGVRCAPNPSPTPEFPSQIVAIAGELPRANDSKSVGRHL